MAGNALADLFRLDQKVALVTGEDGVLRWEYEANRVLVYAPTAHAWRVEEGAPTFVRNDMYLAELRQFAAAVAEEAPPGPLAGGRQAAGALAIALAALRASVEGRAIDLTAESEPVAGWLASL